MNAMNTINHHLLVKAIEQNPLPVLITDASGRIEYVNPRFVSLTGYRSEEVMGRNPRIFSAGKTAPEVYKKLWDTILRGDLWEGDLCNRRKSGEEFWESISISPIRNSEGLITHFVGVWQDTSRRKYDEETLQQHSKEFEKQSMTDDLTGIHNRRHILIELEREVERARRYGRRLSGMMIDIDNFKKINDRYGHLIGDRIIRAFALVLRQSVRKIDILGRYGGDEFLVILPETNLEGAETIAARIQRNLLEYEHNIVADLSPLTASIGLISFEKVGDTSIVAFIDKVDQALLHAKRAGKNEIVVA